MSATGENPGQDVRMATGVPGLDTLLCGGLPSPAVYILQGPPGAGKTVLANQIGFHRAAQGENMVYLTLLAESHDQLVSNLRNFTFYGNNGELSKVEYISGFDILSREGLPGVLKLIGAESRARKASLLVIDGVFLLEQTAQSQTEFRQFINTVEAMSRLLGCIVLLLTSNRYHPDRAEYTMVDGWIELDNRVVRRKPVRELTVHKLRGSDFVGGTHFMTLTSDGVRVLPRLESLSVDEYPATGEVLSSGVSDLDEVLGGGVPRASTTVIIGASGAGKTSYGLSFINECTPEEPGIVFGFYETPARLRRKAMQLGLDLDRRMEDGSVEVLWSPPSDRNADVLVHTLLKAVERLGARRLLVDGLTGLQRALGDQDRMGGFIGALSNTLRERDVTTLYTADAPNLLGGELEISLAEQSATADNIVLLRYMGLRTRLYRTVSVVKARENQFDTSVFEFSIGDKGISLGRSLAGDPADGE